MPLRQSSENNAMPSLVVPLLLSAASAFAQAPASVLEQSYDAKWSKRLVPLLTEVIRFPTYAGNTQAFIDQKAWLTKVAGEFGFTIRDKGKVTEIELPGPTGAPVLGLAVHGDVVPVDDHWTIPPFAGVVKDDMVLGRGRAEGVVPRIRKACSCAGLYFLPRLTPKRCNSGADAVRSPHFQALGSPAIEIDVARFTPRLCPDSWHDPFRRAQ
jgi:hypothetical protein